MAPALSNVLLVLGVLLACLSAATAQGGCYIVPNANADGQVLTESYDTASAEDCCKKCQDYADCDVFVFCGNKGGCDDGTTYIYPEKLCTLKYQGLKYTASGKPREPTYYAKGSIVQWTSGYITS